MEATFRFQGHRFTLKPGLAEKLYEQTLVIELAKLSKHPCYLSNLWLKTPPMSSSNSELTEIIIGAAYTESHVAQILGYLNITGLKTGLLLHFKHAKLGIKRISN